MKNGVKVLGLIVVLMVVWSVFSGVAQAATSLKHVHVWWWENGQQKEWLYIYPGSSITINRDPGSQVQIRIFQANDPYKTVTFYTSDVWNGINRQKTSANYYEDFTDAVGPLPTLVRAYVNTLEGAVTITVNNLASQDPDLYVSDIRVDGYTTPGEYSVGEQVKVECIVWNGGEGTAGSNYLGYYIGTSSTDTSDRWESDSVGALETDTGSTEYEYYTFQASDVGTRYFVLWADYRDDVDEGDNENNNKASFGPFSVYNPNTCPTLDLTAPSSDQTVTQGQSVQIQWNGADPDDEATVSIGYDEDNIFNNGNHAWIALGQSEDGSCSWDTSDVDYGTYYIFGMIYDGQCSAHDYANGRVTVGPEPVYGTTIISHGYQPFGTLPNWPLAMAQAIRDRAGKGNIWVYGYQDDPETGEPYGAFVPWEGTQNEGETILVFDWAYESHINGHGYSEAAGDALFAALLHGKNIGDFNLENLHFIGHSRGCVINSEAVERILRSGLSVSEIHVTTLDPVYDGWGGQFDDHDVNNHTVGDVGVITWEGITWADNYYTSDDCHEVPPFWVDGSWINGSSNENLNGRSFCMGHPLVHTWYHGTINLSPDATDGDYSVDENWYDGDYYPPRGEDGYFFSRIVGGARPSVQGTKSDVQFSYEVEGIINGNFYRVYETDPPEIYPCPGWDWHGGGGTGSINDNHLELRDEHSWREHNRFYIPRGAQAILFKYKITKAGTPGAANDLKIQIKNDEGKSKEQILHLYSTTSDWASWSMGISGFNDSICTLKFELDKGESSTIDFEVWIDDVQLIMATSPIIDLTPSGNDFDIVQVGSCSTEYSFSLTNIGGGTATGSISRSGTNADQFTITSGDGSFSLGAGESKTIKVKFCPTSGGDKNATLYAAGTNCNDDSSSLSGTGVENPELSYSPTSYNFGDKCPGEPDSTTFEIWNSGTGTLTYSLSETCDWVDVYPSSGSSTGEHAIITVNIDTTGLSEGLYTCDTSISSNDESGTFTVSVNVVQCVGQPQVMTNAATNEEETTATLNGVITSDGGEACQYRFEYDINSGEPYASNTGWTGSKTTGQSFSASILSLNKGTKYYFRAQAKNSAGTANGSELTFLTKPDAPTSFNASSAGTTQIDLSWSKGAGAQKTEIQRKMGSYPVNKDDGTQVYFDTGSSKSDTSLSPGTTYYYRAWSYVQGSEQWSDNPAEDWATTTSSIGAPTAIIDSITPDPAEQGTDTVSFSGHGTDSDGSVVAYDWRSSIDGELSTSASFTKPASDLSVGTHTIYFKVRDDDDTWSTEDTEDLTINPAPEPALSFSPNEYYFGDMCEGETNSALFEIWNSGTGTLTYSLSEACGWVEVVPTNGSSTGEHNTITVDIDTTDSSVGSHSCYISISSNGGNETFTVTLNVVQCADPPQVTTNAASDIGTASAMLNGNLDDTGGETCQVWFEYGNTTSYGYSTSPESKSSTGTFSTGISGLDDNTTYHFRAVASNSEETDYGDDRTFTTEQEKEYGVDLIADSLQKTTTLNLNATYLLTIINTGTEVDNYSLSYENIDNAAVVSLNKSSVINLMSGSSAQILLNVTDETEGTYNVSVTATSVRNSSLNDTITTKTIVTLGEIRDVNVIAPRAKSGTPGEGLITHTFGVKNTGTVQDIYDLEATSEHGWTLQILYDNPITVAASQMELVRVQITIPAGADVGTTDCLTLTVTSLTNSSVFSENSAITTVTGAAPYEQWNKTFGGNGFDYGLSVQQTSDGGYIIAGDTSSFGAGELDVYLVKTDENGTEKWNKTFGGSEYDYGYSVQQTSDGGYIIAGETRSFGVGELDIYLVKTDENGTEEWSKTFGGSEYDYGSSVQQTSDGGYVVVGGTESFGSNLSDVWLLKVYANGTEEWNMTYGGPSYDYGSSVQQTADGGYIIAGSTMSFGAGESDFYLVKTDENGTEEWNKTFGGSEFESCNSFQQTADGGYVMAGDKESLGAGYDAIDYIDFYLVKTDENGTEEWNKTFGRSDSNEGHSVQQTSDGGYVMAGTTHSYEPHKSEVYLVKTDKNGTERWSKTFGGNGNACGSSVRQTTDGGYIVAGYTFPLGANTDAWLIKVKGEPTEPYTKTDVGVTSTITLRSPEEIAPYLPPEYADIDIGDAIVLDVNVTDMTPENSTDKGYTDITINVGDLNIATCKVFKSSTGFLPEVEDVTTLPTVKPPGVAKFARDVAKNTVTVRLYVGDPLLAVVPLGAVTGWSEDIRVTTNSADSRFSAIAVDTNNNVHIAWEDFRDGSWSIYYTKLEDNSGNTLVDDTRLTTDSGFSWEPAIAVDTNNNVHITWRDARDENSGIYYTKLDNNGNTLVDDTRLTTDSADSWGPAIAVDTNNNVHIAWADSRNASWKPEIYYTKLDNNGNTLVDDTRLTHSGYSNIPAIAVDTNNNVHIAWEDLRDENQNIYYTKLDNNGNTLVDDTRLTTDSAWAWVTKIAVDTNNHVHITWFDDKTGDFPEIYYTKLDNNGNTLVDDTRLTYSGSSIGPTIAVDTNNHVHITWTDFSDGNGEIYYTKLDNSGNTLVDDTRLTTEPSISNSDGIAVDTNNHVHIVWEDLRDGNFEIYYKNNCDGAPPRNEAPLASFTYLPEYPVVNQTITFNASNSTDQDGIIVNYGWNFDDGNVTNTTEAIIVHSYSAAGTYRVNLTVADDDGAMNTTTKVLTVKSKDLHGVNLTVDDFEKATFPNINATYVLTITNIGTKVDNYTLSVTNHDNASVANLSRSKVTGLQPGLSVIALLNVTDETEGTYDVSVTATSDGNSSVNDTITTKTIVSEIKPPQIVTYTISNRTIAPPQKTEIDVEFSEEVDYTIAIEKDSTWVYDWMGTATNPTAKVWDGTYEANGAVVLDGVYTVNVTGTSTTTGLSVVNNTQTITVYSTILTTISIEDISLGPGESKTVPIYIYNVSEPDGVGTVYLDLLYDPSVVQITGTDDSNTDFTFVTSNVQNTIGKFSVGGSYIGAAPGPIGDVRIIDVTFTAVGSDGDTSALDITNTLLLDATPQQNDIPHEVADGSFLIISLVMTFGVNDASGYQGTTIVVPVEIRNVQNGPFIANIFDISYNTSVITVDSVQRGNLTSSWDWPSFNNFAWGTRVSIVYDGNAAHAIQNGISGSVVLLNFNVVGTPGSSSKMNISNIQLSDPTYNLKTAQAKNGTFTVLNVAPEIVINEFVSDNATEWVELYNKGSSSVDLTGWTLEDEVGNSKSLSALGTIAVGDYAVYTTASGWLNNDGDVILLKNDSGGIIDQVGYGTSGDAPAPDAGKSTGRCSNGVDTDDDAADFTKMDMPTLGAENVCPIDTIAPTTAVTALELPGEPSPIPTEHQLNWTNSPVMLSLIRSDVSGVAYTDFSTTSDAGPWTTVNDITAVGPDAGKVSDITGQTFNVTVDAEGETTIWYYSVDKNETPNVEAIKKLTVKIDTVPPGTVTGLADTDVNWTWIQWNWINPEDPGSSGFDHVEVWLDGVFKENTTGSSYRAEGLASNTAYEIETRAVDVAGNKGAWQNDTATTLSDTVVPSQEAFDTGPSTKSHPSIAGTHNGTITPFYDLHVTKLYTYPCTGTGGHAEYAKISNDSWSVETLPWNGYVGDWHNLSFETPFTLYANETYNFTIRTGSYPQIIHESPFNATGGTIRCTSFEDANGEVHTDWIPAIRFE